LYCATQSTTSALPQKHAGEGGADVQRKPPQATTPDKHPEAYRDDLNPNALAGQNIGVQGSHPEKEEGRSAYDIKEAHEALRDLNADELRELRVLPPGSPLLENATYLDLCHRERGEFHARAGMVAPEEHWYVLKKDVDYELWNKLLGIHDVRRTGTEG
jgi:hypothetical protein